MDVSGHFPYEKTYNIEHFVRFGISFDRKLCLKNFLNINFLYWSLIGDLTGLFSAPPPNILKRNGQYIYNILM